MFRRFTGIFCSIGLVIVLGFSQVNSEDLKSPFSAVTDFKTSSAEPCTSIPDAVVDLKPPTYYSDSSSSIVDQQKFAIEAQMTGPTRRFLRVLTLSVANYRSGDLDSASCALAALDKWATKKALTGDVTRQGGYWRKWTLAGAAIGYLAIREAPSLDPGAKKRVVDWLNDLAGLVKDYYDQPINGKDAGKISDLRNNHAAWAAFAVASVGVASNNAGLVKWGMNKGSESFRQITVDGALPLELDRGSAALSYHLFTLNALAALERLGAVNGYDLSKADRAALDRLAHFTFNATQDPALISKLAGKSQNLSLPNGRSTLFSGAGLEIWAVTRDDAAIQSELEKFRPIWNNWLGGNVTLLWRDRKP